MSDGLADDSALPYKLPVKAGPYNSVPDPDFSQAAESTAGSETLWQKAERFIDGRIKSAVSAFDRDGNLTEEQKAIVAKGARGGAYVGAVAGGAAVGVGGAAACGAALVTGAPYVLCVGASAAGGAVGGSFAGAYVGAAGGWISADFFDKLEQLGGQ